jgi:hypothetical protein
MPSGRIFIFAAQQIVRQVRGLPTGASANGIPRLGWDAFVVLRRSRGPGPNRLALNRRSLRDVFCSAGMSRAGGWIKIARISLPPLNRMGEMGILLFP